MIRFLLAMITTAALAACSDAKAPQPETPRDPAVLQALNDPLMVDPDLSSRNEGAAALTVEVDGALPIVPLAEDAVAKARAEAAMIAGGEGKLLPPPAASGQAPALAAGHAPSDHLALLRGRTACRAKLSQSAIWAARLPAALPIYPRGATLAATGGDGAGCRVAAVRFQTAVPPADVLAFYWQRAMAAGLEPRHLMSGKAAVITGAKRGLAFDVRTTPSGAGAVVELATVTG